MTDKTDKYLQHGHYKINSGTSANEDSFVFLQYYRHNLAMDMIARKEIV